jgi:uncharacterized protein
MNKEQAIKLLQKYAPNNKSLQIVLSHAKKVKQVALSIARKIPDVDLDFIAAAALLHDIGRLRYPPGKNSIRHGIGGAAILRKEGFPKIALVAERHIGVGITKKDIIQQKLKLPLKEYVPRTKEEKIISYADNLVFGSRKKTLKDVIARYRREIGEHMVPRIIKQHEEIMSLCQKRKPKQILRK